MCGIKWQQNHVCTVPGGVYDFPQVYERLTELLNSEESSVLLPVCVNISLYLITA